jgi:hypothetical protein
MKYLDFDEWVETYKPDMDGGEPRMLDIYTDFTGVNPACIWTDTAVDGSNFIASGRHLFNRMGYYITEVPVPEGEFYQIVLYSAEDDEELA